MMARTRRKPKKPAARAAADHIRAYLRDARAIIDRIDTREVEQLVSLLRAVRRRRGRLFILGVGGGAANASHAVNDFRKICGFEAYAPTDNVAELSARTNDDGWDTVFARWLEHSRLGPRDAVFIFSVGGGSRARNISPNLVRAIELARARKAKILGIVGRDGGETARAADACVLVPVVNPATVTAHTEAFQAVLWHLLVSHPSLQAAAMKWESVT